MHVDLAGTQVAPARHGDLRPAEASEQRPHDGRGGAHLGHELVRSFPAIRSRGIDAQRMLVEHVDGGAQALEHLAHHVNIGDVRDVGEGCDARSEQRRRHEL